MSGAAGPLRRFPTGGEYADALQHTHLCFRHPELKGAVPDLTRLQTPKAISGAFASVFSLTSPASGRRYAVKCFTRHVPDQELRYEAISRQLASLDPATLSQPWTMGFEYLPDAVTVRNERYPVLKMDWVQATTLSSWLDAHHHDSTAVDRLADRFTGLAADLAAHGMAHGDLQHGNLLVADDGTFRLVDYDGMYVPALTGRAGTERGHRNYQSPARGDQDFGSAMDRFSLWVIYLALKALAADATLWTQLHEPQGEYLLLTEDDFKNPSASPRFPALLAHPDRTVRDLADQVRALSWQPLDALPPLTATGPAPVAAPASSGGTGLPGWMAGHLPPPVPTAPPGPPLPTGFRGRRILDTLVAVLLPLAVVVPGLLWAAHALASFLLPLPVSAAALLGWGAHRSRPEVRSLREHERSLVAQQWQAAQAGRDLADLDAQQREFEDSEAARKVRLARRRSALVEAHQHDVAAAEKDKVTEMRAIDLKLQALDSDQKAALDRELAGARNACVQAELGKARIAMARLPGIGEKLKDGLALYGIRTAADFTGIRLTSTSRHGYTNVTALIVKPNGTAVNIKGIGDAKARTLDAWRDARAADARSRCTTQLSPARKQAIIAGFDLRRAQCAAERDKAELNATARRAQAHQRLQEARARLDSEDNDALRDAEQQRRSFGQRSAQIRTSQADLTAVTDSLIAARRTHRDLSRTRYLRFVLTGR
ncbi:hypothetical protein I5Q34_32025 [Streptomyces sp. AV19]|uniref:hypothetical protein n=1 Tax=Streptomyces sp. AV19 TaxID=2793068 RepID=UPI0018FE6166|nr:hypothetical protein [Streptomyces sp. AV19]MBH1938835.1 hypothetical protein [Streptomyces sp. AV19]MDG4534768.1 hypothetical protein [Streptomyces sp. AV19]